VRTLKVALLGCGTVGSEVFRLLGQGHATRQIAAALNVSAKTVQAFCARIKEKLGAANSTELLREAIRWVEQQSER